MCTCVVTQTDFECAAKLCEFGEKFIAAEHYAVDSIRPKCLELERICSEYTRQLTQRRRVLDLSHRLYQHVDKVINTL